MRGQPTMTFSMPRPGRALLAVMGAVFAIWVGLGVWLNWLHGDAQLINPFFGDSDAVVHGQLWRLVTGAFIHIWHGDGAVGHVLTTLLGLYFLGPPLEDRWGSGRMTLFLLGSAAFAFVVQILVGFVVPQVRQDPFFGGLGMVDAVAVAWAMQARSGEQVRLMFVLPVTPLMLVGFIFVLSVLKVIAQGFHPEGLVTPFGGMLAGYLFCDTSPLRRYWLKLRLRRIQAETARMRTSSARRAGGPPLRVIPGGGEAKPPPDKRFLN